MTEPTEPTGPAPLAEAPRGLPRWGRVLLIVLAVLIVGAGICTAVVAIAVNASLS